MTNSPHPNELESVLIVTENPPTVLKQIAGLRSILNFHLKPKPVRLIRDTYFDKTDGSLRKRRVNLRIRQIDGTVLVSVKSRARITRGGIQRREMELAWSNSALATIVKQLKLESPSLSPNSQSSHVEPAQLLASIGMQIIQERQTKRQARDITSELEPDDSVLAELAIDHVTYHFENHNVSIFELEVEAKAKGSSSTVRDVTETLLSTYQPALQKWSHGKFVTGDAIERLLRAGSLQNYLDDNGLKPAGLDAIDNAIRSRRF